VVAGSLKRSGRVTWAFSELSDLYVEDVWKEVGHFDPGLVRVYLTSLEGGVCACGASLIGSFERSRTELDKKLRRRYMAGAR